MFPAEDVVDIYSDDMQSIWPNKGTPHHPMHHVIND
jgi:hypothetical protein